jgi:hypothetical protein
VPGPVQGDRAACRPRAQHVGQRRTTLDGDRDAVDEARQRTQRGSLRDALQRLDEAGSRPRVAASKVIKDKERAVREVINSPRSAAAVARDRGINPSTLRRWVREVIPGEQIVSCFKAVRDFVVFTDKRLSRGQRVPLTRVNVVRSCANR